MSLTTSAYSGSGSIWGDFASDLSAGLTFASSISTDLQKVLTDIQNAGTTASVDALTPDLAALKADLANAPASIKGSQLFTDTVAKITDTVQKTLANYQVVDANGNVGGFLSDLTATFSNTDITNSYRSYPGVNFTPLIDQAAAYLTDSSPTYTGTYTVVNSKTGLTETFQVTVSIDYSTGGTYIDSIVKVSPASGQTLQHAIDGGVATVHEVPGSNGTQGLQDLINNLW